jgi:hypothetical protein
MPRLRIGPPPQPGARIDDQSCGELAVLIHREREMTGFVQDDTGVDVELSEGN